MIYSPVCATDTLFGSWFFFSVSCVALLFLLYLQMVPLICVDGNTCEQMLCIDAMRLFKKKLSPSQAWKMT